MVGAFYYIWYVLTYGWRLLHMVWRILTYMVGEHMVGATLAHYMVGGLWIYGIVLIAFKYQGGALLLARLRAKPLTTPFFPNHGVMVALF
jgi:hypothetical protein